MYGYSYCARYLDEEILSRLNDKPYSLRSEEENIEYRSMHLAHWDTSGYPDWPEVLVQEGVGRVEHRNVLNSVFWIPLKHLVAHLRNGPDVGGPLVIQESGEVNQSDNKIRLTVYEDRIVGRDPEEIIEIDRWNMS